MKKFVSYMTSTKSLVWWIPAVVLLMFVTVKSFGFKTEPATKYERIMTTVASLVEELHVAPKKIDDAFSKEVFKRYLGEIDPDKDIFLQGDIDDLKKYDTKIDDELKGTSRVVFVPALNAIYVKRLAEAAADYKEILAKPFDFSTDEIANLDGEKIPYAKNAAEMKEIWRKRLKYMVLERYSDAVEQRDGAKSKTDSSSLVLAAKTDVMIEKESREKVLKIMDRSFIKIKTKSTVEEQFNTYVNTIANTFDPHTDFFPPVEQRAFADEIAGTHFFGIGAQLGENVDGTIKIVLLISGSPAWKSGEIQPNDIVLKVAQGNAEPVDITGYEITDAVKLIRGKKGTEVKLTLKKVDGSVKVVSIIRDEIKQEERAARSAVIKKQNKIGYIYLPEFYGDPENGNGDFASKDVANEIQKLKAEHVDGIILDLRSNGGGLLFDCIKMLGLFIPSGPMVQVKGRDGAPDILRDNDPRVLYDGPLAVMINETSASASEIFAAAIQDYHRGIIVGSPSYGKGTVQRPVDLDRVASPFPLVAASAESEGGYGQLKLSIQKFYRVNGGSTQLKGVTPDVQIPDAYEFFKYIHEKDSPDALPWDEIAKAPIKFWEPDYSQKYVDSLGNSRIKNNPSFTQIRTDAKWLSDQNDKEYPLNLVKYQAEQKTLKATGKQMDNLVTLQQPNDVDFLEADKDRIKNMDKYVSDGFTAWLGSLKKDIYLDETVNVVNDMVVQGKTVKK